MFTIHKQCVKCVKASGYYILMVQSLYVKIQNAFGSICGCYDLTPQQILAALTGLATIRATLTNYQMEQYHIYVAAYNNIINIAEILQTRGAFNLNQASVMFQNIMVIKDYIGNKKRPDKAITHSLELTEALYNHAFRGSVFNSRRFQMIHQATELASKGLRQLETISIIETAFEDINKKTPVSLQTADYIMKLIKELKSVKPTKIAKKTLPSVPLTPIVEEPPIKTTKSKQVVKSNPVVKPKPIVIAKTKPVIKQIVNKPVIKLNVQPK